MHSRSMRGPRPRPRHRICVQEPEDEETYAMCHSRALLVGACCGAATWYPVPSPPELPRAKVLLAASRDYNAPGGLPVRKLFNFGGATRTSCSRPTACITWSSPRSSTRSRPRLKAGPTPTAGGTMTASRCSDPPIWPTGRQWGTSGRWKKMPPGPGSTSSPRTQSGLTTPG